MSTPPPPPSLFSPEYVGALGRYGQPVQAGLNLLYAVVFLVGTLALSLLRRRAMLVIRATFVAGVGVALAFDAPCYRLLLPEITPSHAAAALTGRYLYQTYVMMVCCWLLFPVPHAGRLALSLFGISSALTAAALHALLRRAHHAGRRAESAAARGGRLLLLAAAPTAERHSPATSRHAVA